MDFNILATDYDGTLAWNGTVEEPTLRALASLRESGRHAIMVTGREIADLCKVFPGPHLFDTIVAENGALLYQPGTDQYTLLCPPPAPEFVEVLRQRNVTPLFVGHAIVATQDMYHTVVTETIARLKLPLEIRLNKGAVMVLPAGVNKGSGLLAALRRHGWNREQTIAVGDGENDFDLLAAAGLGVAVSNAVPELKEQAAVVTKASHGEGVVELIGQWLAGTLPHSQASAAK